MLKIALLAIRIGARQRPQAAALAAFNLWLLLWALLWPAALGFAIGLGHPLAVSDFAALGPSSEPGAADFSSLGWLALMGVCSFLCVPASCFAFVLLAPGADTLRQELAKSRRLFIAIPLLLSSIALVSWVASLVSQDTPWGAVPQAFLSRLSRPASTSAVGHLLAGCALFPPAAFLLEALWRLSRLLPPNPARGLPRAAAALPGRLLRLPVRARDALAKSFLEGMDEEDRARWEQAHIERAASRRKAPRRAALGEGPGPKRGGSRRL